MKKTFFSFLMLALVATGARAQLLVGDMNGDGVLNVSDITELVSTILGNTSEQYISGDNIVVERHDFVNLGLTSGTLWATCNIGASQPESFGNFYFAWGETDIHSDNMYYWADYKYCNGDIDGDKWVGITKYCSDSSYGIAGYTDDLTELEAVDDVATAKWGKGWKIPTREQMQELVDECEWTYTTLNDQGGFTVASKVNSNSIFLPILGVRLNDILRMDGNGYYWTSTLDIDSPSNAYYLNIGHKQSSESTYTISSQARSYGMQIRPVRASK